MSSKKSTDENTPKADTSAAPVTNKKVAAGGAKKKVSKKKTAARKSSAVKKKAAAGQSAGMQAPETTVAVTRPPVDEAEPAQAQQAPGAGILRLALVASLLALAIAAYAAYQFTLSSQVTSAQVAGLEDRVAFMVAEQQSLKTGFDGLDKNNATDIKRIDGSLGRVQSSLSELQSAANASMDDIKANLGESVARWKLDEVHSLLTQINRIYQLSGDQAQAVAGLKLAQASLATIDNPRLEGVSTALAEDILSVQSDRNVDIRLLHNRLAGLLSLIPKLTLMEDSRRAEPGEAVGSSPEGENAEAEQDSGILAAGKTLFGDIGNLVKHKDLDAPLQPSLDSAARFVVYESLRLNVQAAMAALLRRDDVAYHAQLELARETLNMYFDMESPDSLTVVDQLEVLASYDITLNAEAISRALRELDRVIVLEN